MRVDLLYAGSKPPNDTTTLMARSYGVESNRIRNVAKHKVANAQSVQALLESETIERTAVPGALDESSPFKFLNILPDVVREAGSRKHNIVASHGGFIRRVARLLSTHGIRGAREASTHLNGSPTRTNNLFVLRLIYDTFTVYLVRHCARQYQKQPGWMNKLNPRGGEYTTPDPGCIVSRNNRMWGTVKLHAHLRAVIGVHERIAFFSSIMNRALQTAASIKQELTESAARGVRSDMASDPIRVVPFCREGGNILNSIGMDVLNRPGDASINAARRRGITGTGVF